jgi:poly(A) polymerase
MAGRAPSSDHARRAATAIVDTLRQRGHVAYFAGGCVRDELLGLLPSDYDVATDATPDRVREIWPRSDLVGACFGVVLVKQRVADATVVVEVATFRSDGAYSDSRRPDTVTFSTPEADAARRDFTVNALFLDPSRGTQLVAGRHVSGSVIDHVGGIADLEARVLRAVGDPATRLAEDHLRALRAVRLVSRLGFTLESRTAEAIRRDATQLRGVSRERIGDEARRMLAHPSRAEAMMLLRDLALERPILDTPDTPNAPNTSSPLTLAPDRHRPGLVLGALPAAAPATLAIAAWALDLGTALGEPDIESVSRTMRDALCLSNEERDEVRHALHGARLLTQSWATLAIAPRKRLAAGPRLAPGLAILRAIDPDQARLIDADLQALAATPGGIAPPPLLTGDHLVAAGWTPGPAFKDVLDRVYDAQLEGRIATPDQAMELAATLRVYK